MRALPILGLFVLALAVPLSTACYAPRIESCRGAVEDFASVEDVRIVDARVHWLFESGSGGASFLVEAPGLNGSCIDVHSELLAEDGTVLHTLDSTLTVSAIDGVPTSSRFYHYRDGDLVRVTTLGRTLEARVSEPFETSDSGVVDAGVSDVGFRPDTTLPLDAPAIFDAGTTDEDAGTSDDDAGIDDASTDDDAG
jgi:hypothetical protein